VNWRVRAERLRALPLPLVLAAFDATPDPRDPAKWHTARGVLSLTGPKFMNWNLDCGGGGAIDLVMHLQRVGFGQALEWLESRFGAFTPPQPEATQAQSLAMPAPVACNWPRVERYLIQERKLPATLLPSLFQSGTLYADARANAVFVLLDTAATPVGAELRGTTALAWRGMAPGSRKDRGFFSVPATGHAIVLCESAIDALSCHAFHPTYRCLSTSGARPDPAWLLTLIAQGQPIYGGFDADPTGDAMAQRMHHLHPSIGRLRPAAKDWNDLLRQLSR
jgi:protein strawberry notch